MEANRLGRKRTLVIVAVMVMVLSVGLPVVAQALSLAPAAAAAPHSGASATATKSTNAQSLSGPVVPTSPHPGTLDVYLIASGGATTVDPSVAYYTVDLEPIQNVYQTLVNYNGSSTATFVPTLSTCVPGTAQCSADYAGFTGIYNVTGAPFTGSNGQPRYWSFPIDPAARFYDNSTHVGWPVYPTDLEYSLIRTIGFADLPGFAYNPGWIQAQSLVNIGNPGFDGGIHFPFNNTPGAVLSSMLINDSSYCPAAAMDGIHGNGCITFDAYGSGVDWPAFLQFVADNLGSSAEPCGWFQAQITAADGASAAVPGFSTNAANGDGPCTLPGGGTSTSAPSFVAYLAGVSPTAYDNFEGFANTTPVVDTGTNSVMLGSGPYMGTVSLSTGYGLVPNPDYAQPSACGGNPGTFAQYTGYCDPAVGSFIPNVHVAWENDDTVGLADYNSGTADWADVEAVHTPQLLSLQSSGKLQIVQASSLTVFQADAIDQWNATTASSQGLTIGNIPSDFFGHLATRQLMAMSYPYSTIESTINTVDGLQFTQNFNGFIPNGMGCYYAPDTTGGCTNSYTVPNAPYLFNGGNVQTNASVVGGAAWWWAQGNNPASPVYDPELAACTHAHPCTYAIQGAVGSPSLDAQISDWISEIKGITGGAIVPTTQDLTFHNLLVDCFEAPPGQDGCAYADGFGWIPDYPDPSDYSAAYGLPDGTYTGPAAINEELTLPGNDNTGACGHFAVAPYATLEANLQYWAAQANASAIADECQGVAWTVEVAGTNLADSLGAGDQRILLFDQAESIYTALGEFTWVGQQHVYFSAAPWIDPSTINTNTVIGVGDDQFWFQMKYVTGAPQTVTFKESHLPKGTSWGISAGTQFASGTSSKLTVQLTPGSYTFSVNPVLGDYVGTVASHSFTVLSGKSLTIQVHFISVGSTVKFHEKGLPKGTEFNVTAGGVTANNTNPKNLKLGPIVTMRLPNGTYSYTLQPIPGFTGSTGVFTVGPPFKTINVKVTYTPYNGYQAAFVPSGIPNGSAWHITLKLEKGTGFLHPKPSGVSLSSNATYTWTGLANGTYDYTVTAKGFNPITGSFSINGVNATVDLTFTAKAGSIPHAAPALLPVPVMAAVAQRSRATV